MATENSPKTKKMDLDEFYQTADEIIERFRDADIPRALEAAQKIKQATSGYSKKDKTRVLTEYFGKIRDILIAGTIYASSKDDSQVLVRVGGPLDAQGLPLTEDMLPQGEFFMFDAIDSLIESANELFPKSRLKREALADSYFLIRELVAKKYADGELDSYDAEAELDEAAYGLLPRKKGPIRDLSESWKHQILSDIVKVHSGAHPDGTMSAAAEKAAFDLHKRFNALSEGPDEPTRGYNGVFMTSKDQEEGPTCHLNGRLLVMENMIDETGQPRVVLGSQFAPAGEVLKIVREIYPKNDSPLTDAYREKYEISLGALLPNDGS